MWASPSGSPPGFWPALRGPNCYLLVMVLSTEIDDDFPACDKHDESMSSQMGEEHDSRESGRWTRFEEAQRPSLQ